jgi:exopolysaccharide biosynthesis polyprenyl glycosylphosphotransferase
MGPVNKAESLSQQQIHPANVLPEDATRSLSAYLVCKRIIDIVIASIGLLLSSPVLVILMICIKLEDPKAPAIFRQERIGFGGKPFIMYKLRSMVANAEELLPKLLHQSDVSGHMFKMKHDPRITRIGRFIRKTSLDELPQLWNVLKGDMSLVGPRPPLPREVEEYSDYHRKRLAVQPGCTGLWQISGRNHVGFEEMVELDLKYIRERSLVLDMKIICKTFLVFFGKGNAY